MITLELKDKYELLALYKTICAAKFTDSPHDPVIQSSPYVANTVNNIVQKLIEVDAASGDQNAQSKWEEWLKIDLSHPNIKLLESKLEEEWVKESSREQVSKFIEVFLAPWKITCENRIELLEKYYKNF